MSSTSDVEIIGVAGRDDPDAMAGFVADYELDITNVSDESGDIWSRFGITSQPSWVFFNDDGTYETLFGALGAEGLESAIDDLVAR